jgi:flagellar hook-basal body complex protein FliE
MGQIQKIGWYIEVDGKKYGDAVVTVDPTKTNKDIKNMVGDVFDVLKEQAIETIQKVITGKTDSDVMFDRAKAESNLIHETKD